MTKYAIVESGGKQYKVTEGATLEVDRLPGEVGEQVVLDQVLLVAEDGKVHVGTPTVPGAQITATIQEHFKGPKIIVFKYRPKKRYRVKTGHRQQYTRLLVNSISVVE
ncbi:50S ribosomal protein L21 [Thermanaerothrix sp.]|jgi:large subunit ribosomal protein L21|uniref:50S ribosomal protein L21 n=1 Tax=Thermanaerothrix sp. TaxID=2972675 RepID=UPI002ADD7688|nr:50S ribosomal protein L21 [Thermanaerothrix sp.]